MMIYQQVLYKEEQKPRFYVRKIEKLIGELVT